MFICIIINIIFTYNKIFMIKKYFTLFLILFSLTWCIIWNKKNTNIEIEPVIWFSTWNIVKNVIITSSWINLEEKIVEWSSMEPMLLNGTKVLFNSWFYDKNDNLFEHWDIILYNFKWDKLPILKSIVATENDKVEILNNTLYVNDIEIKNSVWDSYRFTESEQNIFNLYINSKNNIPKKSIFVLWDNINESIDSRKFWAVSTRDIYWKVIFKK